MDLAKQYIIQCIITAANNLRLSSEKIETVALIREKLNSAENLTEEIKNFKKITELSKLGIKLSEIHSFIENQKIDFLKLSDKFKEHSYGIVGEMNSILDVLTPQAARAVFQKQEESAVKIDLAKNGSNPDKTKLENFISVTPEIQLPHRSKADEMREAIIFEELNKEVTLDFENYEDKVLRPVKELDSFLNRVMKYEFTENEIKGFIRIMKDNAELSRKIGFEILSNMHQIFSHGLELIDRKKIAASANVVESLRACLIVIVAVVRGKEVDITGYLTRAENFGKSISSNQKER
ncbi:MAG: hypothetical protein CVV24_10185 [Ignavibacteriae bacterium HGW-Ignavibacteriae-3]|nr:MAG: hypothetical protein CVV24_10185 [Ignavibacteriae bacterium HGW-Ignavibacteriae-3]